MLVASASRRKNRHSFDKILYLITILLLLIPAPGWAQGSGRASTGTGGNHVIQGYVFFPSGRRAEGSIQIKLQSHEAGEISVMADTSGSFIFPALAPGNYTVVVNAGEGYEPVTERVYIDNDVNLSRMGIPAPSTSRRYTVMVHLQLKREARVKASVINAALAEVPVEARKLYEKGLEHAQAGEKSKAVDSLKAAVALYPKFPLALNELGVQYLRLGRSDKAIEVLQTSAELSPEAFPPKLNLGIAYLEAKRFNEAVAQLQEALKQNATAPTAHLYLGLALSHEARFEEAEKELLRAIETGGSQLGIAHYYLGGLYWRKRDYTRAVEELETYLRLNPSTPDAERVRSTIKDLRGRIHN